MVPQAGPVRVRPMNWMDKLVYGNNVAGSTDMVSKDVVYNPTYINEQTNPAATRSVLAHELTHRAQNNRTPYLQRIKEAVIEKLSVPYHQRGRELEAYQASEEADPNHTVFGRPDFVTGKRAAHRDIPLPTDLATNAR